MMRRSIIYAIAAAAAVGGVASGVPNTTATPVAWTMPTPYPEATFHTVNIKQFADEVRRATDGRLDIKVHGAGSLLRHEEIKNAVRGGRVPIGEFLLSRLGNQDPLFEADAVPFLAAGYGQAAKLWHASRPKVEEMLEREGLTVLFSVPWPPQGLYADEPVATVEDLRGRKFRADNTATERLARLAGAVPTRVEAPDIPRAFATGRVEAMIAPPSTGTNGKAWDFVDHYYHTQAWLPKNIVVVNERAFRRLDDDVRQAVLEAAKAAEQRGWGMSKAETAAQLAVLRENGVSVEDPSPELAAGLREIGRTMTREWVRQTGPDGQAIVDALASGGAARARVASPPARTTRR